jgi:transcriptional regulator with XRE-family HTH domain
MDTGTPSSSRSTDAVHRFGPELRRWRTRAGLTQRELASRVRYSRETIAAVERGRRYATRQLAQRCDEVLATGGVLGRLWPRVETARVAADRRRGPRRPRHDVDWPELDLVRWVQTVRPAVDEVAPEVLDRLRELINDRGTAVANGG